LVAAYSQLNQEHNEVVSRLGSETEEKERAQQEMHQLRKQVITPQRVRSSKIQLLTSDDGAWKWVGNEPARTVAASSKGCRGRRQMERK